MSVNEPMVKYGALLDSLRELVQSGSTGTLFVATNDNHSANFGFEDGEIVAIRCQRFRGIDALDAVLSIQFGRCRFVPHSAGIHKVSEPLPPTSELLEILEANQEIANSLEPQSAPASVPAPQPAATLGLSVSNIQRIVEDEAMEYLGPMAGVVCDEHFEEIPPTSEAAVLRLLGRISAEINDKKREDEFKTRTLSRLDIDPTRSS